MTQEEMEAAPVGDFVYDAVGDRWFKRVDGSWEWESEGDEPAYSLSSHDLLHVWGPVESRAESLGQ